MALTDEKARQARLDARREIVQAANRHIVVSRARCPFNPGPEIMAPFTMRHIQRWAWSRRWASRSRASRSARTARS